MEAHLSFSPETHSSSLLTNNSSRRFFIRTNSADTSKAAPFLSTRVLRKQLPVIQCSSGGLEIIRLRPQSCSWIVKRRIASYSPSLFSTGHWSPLLSPQVGHGEGEHQSIVPVTDDRPLKPIKSADLARVWWRFLFILLVLLHLFDSFYRYCCLSLASWLNSRQNLSAAQK